MDIVESLDVWITSRLTGLQCTPETTAYVAGVLKALCRPVGDDVFAKRSIVLAFAEARLTGDFVAYQRIGDWVLWTDVVLPTSIERDREVVESIGRASYYSCFKILRGQWRVYEELADELPTIAAKVRARIV